MPRTLATTAAIVAAGAALMLPATDAAAAAQTADAAGITFDLGPSPIGLPADCSFSNGDANFVYLDGNAVGHDTSNNNGDWGGETIEGTASFMEGDVALYEGHLTIWGGGGNNAKAQTEGGLTLTFTGTGPGGRLTIHVSQHSTTNAGGRSTANQLVVQIGCG